VFINNKAKVASRVGCSERRVVYFRKLLFKSDKKKLRFRRVDSQKVCRHPGRDLFCLPSFNNHSKMVLFRLTGKMQMWPQPLRRVAGI